MLVENSHEAWLTSFLRAIRVPLLVGRGQEEHVKTFDKGFVVRVDYVVNQPLVNAVC